MADFKHFVYQDATIEFVTASAQTCLLLEHTAETDKETFIEKSLYLLPLLYLKTHILQVPDTLLDGEPQHFVAEEDYNYVRLGVQRVLGSDDAYIEVFVEDMKYNDEPVTAYISENMADIYQELKDMAASFQTGQEEVMNDAVAACLIAFREHWGIKLLNAMRALHVLSLSPPDED